MTARLNISWQISNAENTPMIHPSPVYFSFSLPIFFFFCFPIRGVGEMEVCDTIHLAFLQVHLTLCLVLRAYPVN